MLIGNDNLFVTVIQKIREGPPGAPIAAKCRLGWSIYGATGKGKIQSSFHIDECTCDRELHDLVKQHFQDESRSWQKVHRPLSIEEERAYGILKATTKRVGERFETGLLWKFDDFEFPNSRPMAERRHQCLERRMKKNPVIGESVRRQMIEYVEKGYIHLATDEELDDMDPRRANRQHFASRLGVSLIASRRRKQPRQINAITIRDAIVECRLSSSLALSFLIDSGADVNIIGGNDWSILKKQYLSGQAKLEPIANPDNRLLRAYATANPMTINCAFKAKVEVVGASKPVVEAEFLVVDEGRRSLLGRCTANELRLLDIGLNVHNCEEADDLTVFPKIPGVRVRFSIDKSVPPEKNAYFNVPAAYREAAKRRLEEMAARGIIEKVTSAPRWISGMSAVPKGKNDFRLVVNMRAPNKAIKREYFRLPLVDEMRIKLHGAKYFTKLDLSNAFYHLELSRESRDLTTFLTETGMFRFTRLMFGVNCAPEVFQREMTRILEGIENVIIYIDDILIYSPTLEELRKITAKVLKVLRINCLTLNNDKCIYEQTRVKFLGHELDERGFHVEEAKIKAIRQFRDPTTTSELKSFLGLASFVSPHIQNFAEITNPLWAATATKNWLWGPEQQKAFRLVKESIITSTTTLSYFSENDKTILYTDASPNALGAVLVQQHNSAPPRIISFGSKSLTETEKKYAQNQREALATVWAVEHFSFFLRGRHFTLRTDAQGVTFILNRSRENSKRALTRADGWALRLSPYNYDVEYIRGNDNIADPSSRLYTGHDEPFDEQHSPWEIATLESNVSGFLTESEIRTATKENDILQKVIDALETNIWAKDLIQFQRVAAELSVEDNMLVRNGCVVIPKQLQQKALDVAHSGHPMIAKMKSILRERVWWPSMNQDVQNWIESCQECATNGRPERPTPMKRKFAPQAAWDTIAIDFNGPYGKLSGISILVVVDYRSRFVIAAPVSSTSFEHARRVLDTIFDREGFPKCIRSDNGPPFNSEQYKKYCSDRGIHASFSTPLFPQQNGLVEGYMKLVNKAMATAISTGSDYKEALKAAVNAHNAAAHSITGFPPEEIMYGRKIKRNLPLLHYGKTFHDENLLSLKDRQSKLKGKALEDARRGARICRIKPGDDVIIKRTAPAKGDSKFLP
ncbi:uncharacterized protein K02A2.6-like [Uranotaenia lowii]|uniref:uncharacterized protein K02A2.6-like n=1 Tax=Uranotaenia lowii TaxID=190385 RepID=UPI00247856E7|nr:uncharacterized protein K02A2.6-like [Uranotaenia lowii]